MSGKAKRLAYIKGEKNSSSRRRWYVVYAAPPDEENPERDEFMRGMFLRESDADLFIRAARGELK